MERLGGKAPGVPRPSLPQVGQPPVARPPMEEYMGPRSDEYVIADDPTIPAFVRGASGATLGSVGGIMKSIGESRSGSARPLASGPNFAGLPGSAEQTPAGSVMQRMGDAALAADDSVQATFARDASIKNFMDDPGGAMSDPRWWMDSTFSAAGSMLPMLATGAGTGAGISRVAASRLIAPEVGQAAVQYGPSVAAALTEATQVYGNTYGEARKAGLDPELSREAAALVASVTGLTSIPAHKVGIFNDQIRSIGRRLAAGSMAEGGQEGVQTWWENVVAKNFYDPNRPLLQGVPEAVVGAGIVGAATGSHGINEQTPAAPTPEMQQEFAGLERENRRPTFSPPPSGGGSVIPQQVTGSTFSLSPPVSPPVSPPYQSIVPAPPPGFEIDVPPPAPRIDPADAPAIAPPQAEVAPLPPPPAIPEVEARPGANSAIEFNDIEENQAPLPGGDESPISPIEVPAPGPRKEVVQPESVDAAAPVADWNERSYQDAQDRIDAFESELEKKGVNLSRLLSRDMDLSIMPPDWSYQPQELSDLYKQRDAIGEYEDSMLRSEIGRRLEPLVGAEKAKLLASKMMELDRLPANRTANNKNNFTQYGVIANEALKTAMEEAGDEGRWVSVDAVLGGDANNPGVQLRLHRASGYDLPSKATFARAQQILDAALEGDAPRIPTEEPYRPSYPNREVQEISSPVAEGEQAPPVDPGPVAEATPVQRDLSPQSPGTVEDGPPTWAKAVKGVFGRRSPAKTARGYKVDTQWGVVPLGSLRISNTDSGEINPEFPGQLQPRQRDRKSSDEQIQTIIERFDPDQVAESYIATDGAPIVGEEDGAVESGNGRSMAIRRIYEQFPDKASSYRQWMINNADRFGLDASAVSQIDRPVLVRIRRGMPEGVTRADFGRDANERTTAVMSPAEQSAIDAKGLDSRLVNMFVPEGGDINSTANTQFVNAFIEKLVPVSERNAMRASDGRLSTGGVRRIQNAIFAKAYEDRGMVERMAEDPDDNIRSVVGAMVAAAPRFISIKSAIASGDLHPLDISNDLSAAASTLSNLRAEGKQIDDYLSQVDMFGRPEIQDAILTTLRDLGRSKARFGDILNQYADAVEAIGSPKQVGMFGQAEIPSPIAIWASIVEREQLNARGTQENAAQGPVDAGGTAIGDGSRKGASTKIRRAQGEQAPKGPSSPSATITQRSGNTVEQTPSGPQETLVTDIEARESQIAARNDRNRPIAEVPFSLVSEEAPQPTGPDERQESMFGDDNEIASYAPGGDQVAAKTPKPSSPKPPATHGSMVSRSAIVKDLSAILNDIPIRQGLFRVPGALGIFKTRQGVIRTKKALDLPTIAHEIGHAIHKRIWGIDAKNPNKLNSGPLRKFKKELGPLDYDPQQSRPFEGFAEYIRLALTEPATAQKRAPQFHAWFQSELAKYPELSGTLDKIADRIQDWEQQPAPVKLAAGINVTPESDTFWSKFVSFAKDTKYELVDDKIDLKKTVELFKRLGADVDDTANSYRLARMANASYTRAHHSLMEGTVGADYKASDKGGLRQILQPIATRKPSERNHRFSKFSKDWGIKMANDGMDDLRMYLVARRLQDYMKRGLETGFTNEQLNQAINATKTPAIVSAADEIHNFQNRVLDYVTDKGAMSPESVDWIRANNEFYVPLYRVMDDAAGKALLGRKMIDLNSPVMKRRGSQREIIDPLESIVRNTYTLYSFADRNEVAATLVKQAARVQDQGALIESGIVMPMKRTELSLAELKPQIEAAMEEAGIEIPEDLDLDVVAAIFRPNMDPQRSRGIVRVIVDGKPELFKMDPTLIRALDSMDKASANLLVKLGRPWKNLLTFGATAGNPEFVITNWNRDQIMAGIQSRNGYVPFIHGWYGAFKLLADKKLVEEWTLNGGASSAIMPLTRDNLRLSVDKMTMGPKDLVLRHPAQLFDILKDVLTTAGTYSEQSTRLAEYALAKKKGKSSAEAALDSRDVTLDFERMGKTARAINEVVPFFAVAINAMDRFAEMHNPRNPALFKRALTIGAGMAMASLSLWMINKDDEDYKAIEDWKRDLFWLIPTKPFGLEKTFGPFIRIAKPPLWGQLYGSTMERWADSLYNHDPLAFEGFASTIWQQAVPPMAMQAMRPWNEIQSNYNDFTDRPIESQAMQRVSPENRYTASTSEAAKKMSKAFKSIGIEISPVKVEHLMLGYTAGLGRFVTTSTEELLGMREDRPAMGPADIPILRAMATPYSPYISKDYKLYDQRVRKLQQRRNDAKLTGNKSDGLTAKEAEDLKQLEKLGREFSQIRAQQYANAKAVKVKKLTNPDAREQARDANDALAKKRELILRKNRHLFSTK